VNGEQQHILCKDLDEEIERYKAMGYRLDMILPASDPREALMSEDGRTARLVKEDHHAGGTTLAIGGHDPRWIPGRAGMEYRDLITARLDVAVSHIRLTSGGPVPDYVHYHNVDFQLIYCLTGRIRVVYEDQGEPFWLESGDCVVQPSGIRHRVLECTGGSEVVEVSMPAEHETWVEHEITLPTSSVQPDRLYQNRPFIYKRSMSVGEFRELLSLRGLGAESDPSLSACAAIEAARSHDSV
jgi:quercetin dioxygenase-like cupin family protein